MSSPTYILKQTSSARTIRIRLSPQGEVHVSAPRWVSTSQIETFVSQQSEWIETHQQKIAQRRATLVTENSLAVFGKTYQVEITSSSQQRFGVSISGEKLLINTSPTISGQPNRQQADKLRDQFLKATAEKYLVPRTHQLAAKMNTTFKRLSLRQQRTRWGSCSTQGNLNFNWRLVHYPPEIIDSVIVHELAHRTHMNHSRAFWALVAKFDPAYKRHQIWLKNHGMSEG